MEIRYVTSLDNPLEISEIYEKSWKYAYRNIIPLDYLDSIPKGQWANNITKEGMHSLVLNENNRIVGTASFCKSRWKQYNEYGEIVSIYFLPEYMGKGYGRYLLNACVEELKKNGFTCTDNVLEDNIGGKNLKEIMFCKVVKGVSN